MPTLLIYRKMKLGKLVYFDLEYPDLITTNKSHSNIIYAFVYMKLLLILNYFR